MLAQGIAAVYLLLWIPGIYFSYKKAGWFYAFCAFSLGPVVYPFAMLSVQLKSRRQRKIQQELDDVEESKPQIGFDWVLKYKPLDLKGQHRYDYWLPVVGVSFHTDNINEARKRSDIHISNAQYFVLVMEPYNEYDSNAVGVYWMDLKIGHLSKEDAAEYTSMMKEIGYESQNGSAKGIVGELEKSHSKYYAKVKLDIELTKEHYTE
jgi:hypothetical protein